jgi:hypothetical protein
MGAPRALLALLLFSGCSSSLDPKSLQGRWLDQKEDAFLELTPSGLAAEVAKAPDAITAYRWELAGRKLKLSPLTKRFVLGPGARWQDSQESQWEVSLKDDVMRLLARGKRRTFKRVSDPNAKSELAGLWKITRDDGKSDFFEFTPWGDEIGLGWFPPYNHPAEKKITPQRAPEWSSYSTVGDEVELSGVSPFRRGRKLRLNFKREGNRLTLTPGHQRGRKNRPAPFTLMQTDKVDS